MYFAPGIWFGGGKPAASRVAGTGSIIELVFDHVIWESAALRWGGFLPESEYLDPHHADNAIGNQLIVPGDQNDEA